MTLVTVGIFSYVALQLVIGLVVSRRNKSEDDYFLAGRSLGYGLATFTLFATWFGAETCVGAAGRFYEEGLAGGSADPFGYALCLIVLGLFFAAPLWRRKFTTLADLFRERFGIGVERFSAILMIPTSVLWAAAQIRSFGQVLDASAGIGTTTGIAAATAMVILYTTWGGMRADVITDLIQGIAIIAGLGVLFFAVYGGIDGAVAAWQSVEPERRQLFGGADTGLLDTLEAWAIPICGSVLAQELVMRMLAARSPEVARRSALMGGGLYLAVGLVPAFFGLTGVTLMANLDDPEQLLPLLAEQHLPTFLYVLFVGALVSAILSTVDSTLIASASLASHNLLVPFRRGLDDAGKVRLARTCVTVFGLAAFGLAVSADSVYELVSDASAFGSSGILVAASFGLFTRFGGGASALASLIAGALVWILGNYVFEYSYSYLASLAAALTGYVGVAAFTRSSLKARPAADPVT